MRIPSGAAARVIMAAVGVALSTLLLVAIRALFASPVLAIIYLLPITVAGVAWGWSAALFSAALAFLSYDIFFTEPAFAFSIRDPGDWLILLTFLAIAGVTARLAAREGARRRQLEAVREVAAELAVEPDLRALLDLIVRRAAELVGASVGVIYLWDEAAGLLTPAAWHGVGEWIALAHFGRGEGAAGLATERRAGVILNDYRASPHATPLWLERSAIGAVLAEPILYRERLVGAIALGREGRGRPFGGPDRELLGLFAHQAAVAIENARMVTAARRRADEALAVARVGRAITGSLDPRAVLELIVEQACPLLGTGRCAVAVVESEAGGAIYRFAARRGLSEAFPDRVRPRHARDGTTALAVVERRPVWSADILNDPAFDLSAPVREGVEAEGYRAVLSAPLLIGDRCLGALVVYRDEAGPFAADEVELLRVFADQAAIALENARLFEREQERRRQLEAVRDVAAEIAGELDLEALLDLILRRAAALVGATTGGILLWDAAARTFAARTWLGIGDWIAAVQFEQGVFAAALGPQASGAIINDFRAWPHAPPVVLERTEVTAALVQPILARDRMIGVLAVGRERQAPPFVAADLELLGLFADQAAIALQNAHAFQREQERRRQLEAVRAVTAELARELDLTALLGLIIERAAALTGAASGAAFLWDEDGEVLVPRAWRGLGAWAAALRVKPGEGAVGAAAEGRAGVLANEYRASRWALPAVLEHTGATAVLAQPILYQGRLIGAIAVNREDAERPFAPQDLELLGLFADQAAIAIEHARLFEQAAGAEALAEVSRLKSEFLSTVSHELRTPLWLVRGYAELLSLRGPGLPPDEVATFGAEIERASGTLMRLVDDLLDFGRVERGQLRLERRRVEPAEVLLPLLEAFRSRPGGERIAAEVPRGLQADLDPDRLTQVVSNLLTNALRYAPAGPITLRAEDRGGSLCVEVSDRGPGIPGEEQPRIWEPFYRGARDVNSPRRGSGLGLAVVKRLVELHGGRVGVRSAPGEGATFWFSVPIDGQAGGAPRPPVLLPDASR